MREAFTTLRKLVKMPWAVSGRRYAVEPEPSTGPSCVLNIRLNCRGSVKKPAAWHSVAGRFLNSFFGQTASCSLSSRKRDLHSLQSTSGSLKPGDVARGLPDPRALDDRAVEADDVPPRRDHRAPPVLLGVAQQLDAEGPVVVAGVDPAVDLARLEDEAPAFAEAHDTVHQIVGAGGHEVDSRQCGRRGPRRRKPRASCLRELRLRLRGREDGATLLRPNFRPDTARIGAKETPHEPEGKHEKGPGRAAADAGRGARSSTSRPS